jgi:hypothetical protein
VCSSDLNILENDNFLQNLLELATSSQKSIARIRNVAAEISKFYVPLTVNLSPLLNFLFSFINQQMFFNQTIKKLTLTRFTISFPYNLWTDQPRQLEEEIPAENEQTSNAFLPYFLIDRDLKPNLIADYLATGKSNVAFLSHLVLAKNLASNLPTLLIEPLSLQILAPKLPSIFNPAVSQEIDSSKIFAPFSQESWLKKAARPEEKYSSTASGSLSSWVLPSFLLAHRITSDLVAVLAEQPPQARLPQKTTPFLKREAAERLVQNENPMEPVLSQEADHPPKAEIAEKLAGKEITAVETSEISHVNQMIKWQSNLSSKISESVKSIISLEELAMPLVLSVPTFEIISSDFTGLLNPKVSQSATLPSEKATVEDAIAMHPSITKVTKEAHPLPSKQVSISEAPPSELTVNTRLSSFGYATLLPALILEKQTPFLGNAVAISQASSLQTMVPGSKTNSPYVYPLVAAQTILSFTSKQMNLLEKQISPSITSWIYDGSEVLRSTGVPLSAVPIAAYMAEKSISETLIQPMSTFVATSPQDYGKPTIGEEKEKFSRLPTVLALAGIGSLITHRLARDTSPSEEASKEKTVLISKLPSPSVSTGVWQLSSGVLSNISEQQKPFFEIAEILSQYSSAPTTSSFPMIESPSCFRVYVSSLASIVPAKTNLPINEVIPSLTSWIYEVAEALRRTGVPLSAVPIAASEAEKVVNETLINAAPSQWAAQPQVEGDVVGEQRKASTLPTVLALAGAESLINRQLQNALTILRKESTAMQLSDQRYSGINILGTSGIQKTNKQTRVKDGLIVQYPIEHKADTVIPISLLPRTNRFRSPAQDSIGVKSAEEEAEEDLSDLERKISKILSEQLSRYYGTSKL